MHLDSSLGSFAQTLAAGRSHLQAGDWDRAAAFLSSARRLQPQAPGLSGLLGVALLQAGQPAAAEAALRAALVEDPADREARLHLAAARAAQGDRVEAEALLRAILAEAPEDAVAQRNLAVVLGEQGRLRESAAAWSRLTVLCPADVGAWIGAGMAWLGAGAPHPAQHAFTQVLAREPHRPGVQARLGTILLDMGDHPGAERHLEAALALDPGQRVALAGMARLRLRQRDHEAAAALLGPLMASHAHEPEVAALWSELCRRERRPQAALQPLRAALAAADSPSARGLLLHRIAEVMDDLGAPDAAMDAWDAANAAERGRFQPAAHTAALRALVAAYAGADRPLARASTEDPLPVFIVGMPRSGTSLLEQMLDRHPEVKGLGEREEIRQIAAGLPHRLGPGVKGDYFHHLESLTVPLLDRLAEGHRSRLRGLVGLGVTRAIDKMPHNFMHLGLIGQMLPGARVLHCVRDPVDTCFSCYRQRFSAGLPYTTRLDWLGAFYRSYAETMAAWTQLQPVPILEVRYEDLVSHPEPVLRAVLDFLGLPWHADCLQFHRSARDVGTASHAQVQRPLYTSSVGKAGPYRHRLGPLLAALGDHRPVVPG